MEAGVKTKRGYSIWSLMVIMTLVGTALSLGSLNKFDHTWNDWVFFTSRLIALWGLSFGVIWLLTGKRRTVMVILSIAMLAIWGPLVVFQIEGYVSNHTGEYYAEALLKRVGLYEGYQSFYLTVVTTAYEASAK